MTPLDKVYDAFLVKILDDDWTGWMIEDVKRDWRLILDGAIPYFKFPRKSLAIEGDHFVDDLDNEEIQILATFMKCEWLNRTILTWENVKPLYTERDFSQANLLDKFNQTLAAEKKNAAKLEQIYYRAIKNRPYHYSTWATRIDD